jgi:RimJ/RimL family protein N-acetyltransferase
MGSSSAASDLRYAASVATFSLVREVAAIRAAISLQRRIGAMVAVVYDRPVGEAVDARDYSSRDLWHPPQLVGRSVALRRPHPDDLSAVVRWYRDPELARLTRYQTRPMSHAEIERFFQVRMLSPDALAYCITELPDRRLVGFTTFSSLDADNGSVLFHITIGERNAWGRGLGTEATQLMLGHAFDRLALHRVGLTVFSYNVRAIRAYEKAGFRVEGRLRDAIMRDGRYFDEVQMGILADEWLQPRTSGEVASRERVHG